ncbi:hypothetical protein M3223_15890 [Paenibacillus pasadenensis]|uniref:hypothetical protein n=1 Tax=Paenibacillus pasadenensis TaxID=217090 RepID=UPI00203CF09B|nr:hypothetical protein [Paenibacillus pasadenensis]MCM3748835.1 hypothetical protein [Paenibacillus pasadenensis]
MEKHRNKTHRAKYLAKSREEIESWGNLGALPEVPIEGTLASLHRALPDDYIQQIKQRYLKEHPHVAEDRFELLLFELKRYFVVCSVLKSVPMFSDEVDSVWHEMIMYTREYERFGQELLGGTLHHAPAVQSVPDPGGRAWFDLIYSYLFRLHDFTQIAWGPFFRHPLDKSRLLELQTLPEEELRRRYFREGADPQLVRYLLDKLIHQGDHARNLREELQRGSVRKKTNFDLNNPAYGVYFAGLMVMYSIYHQDTYATQMEQQLPRDPERESSSASVCAASGCAGDSKSGNDGGSHDGSNSGCSGGSNSSNNSSCSSSSCSSGSSCGGGGCGGGGS